MSAPVLKYTLVVRHPDTTVATPLLAGQPVPDWAEGLVDDEDLVHDEADGTEPGTEPEPEPAKKTTARKAAASKTEQQ